MLASLQTLPNGFYSKMEHKGMFKPIRVHSMAESLAQRCQSMKAERQEKRREFFWGRIVASESLSAAFKTKEIQEKKNTRIEMLQKWKAEKMKRLEEAKKKQKPVFKVGVVQRKVTGSPIFSQQKNLTKRQPQIKSQTTTSKDTRVGVITRARARKMTVKPTQAEKINSTANANNQLNNKFCRIDKSKKQPVNSLIFNVPEAVRKLPCSSLTLAYSPKFTRKSRKLTEAKVKAPATPIPEKPEEDVPKENFMATNEKETTPESAQTQEDDFRVIHYSPFVTVRSGKKSGRKSKKTLTINVEEQIEKEEKEFQCRIFSFRKYIDCETKRLLERCHKWKRIYEEFPELPSDAEGDIDAAIGKTNLLTSDKFKQFGGLIDKCENGDPYVKVDDLQGFQDWVSIEVERIDGEFCRLEKRKCNNWKPEVSSAGVPEKQQAVKPAKNAGKKPVGKSNIRSHILAARKLLKEGNANGGEGSQLPVTFSFEESAKANAPRKDHCLLREVLNPEKKLPVARERRNSGLEIMAATQKNKFPTPAKLQKSAVVTDYEVLLGADTKTPNRSILKKTPKTSSSSRGHVTFKKSGKRRGLSEKYFQPLMDTEESSPMRTILGDLGNLSVGGVRTRSKTRLMSRSESMSPMVQ